MKKLLQFTPLALTLCWSLSGCNKLFDVPPREIYSPIELDGKLLPQKISEAVCKVRFVGNDATLTYGALVFYDSLAAASFVQERKTVGRVQFVTAIRSSTATANQFISDTIKFDNTKGQYLYITPLAYRSEDSLAIRTQQDYRKAFSSQGYIRLKISPWTHVTDLPGPTLGFTPVLFPIKNNLFCIKYDSFSKSDTIYSYEFDPTTIKWTGKGRFQNELCQGKCQSRDPTRPTRLYITGINNAYFANNEYHLFVNTYLAGDGFLQRYGIGEVITDQNFAYKTTSSFLNNVLPSYYSLINVQDDRAIAIRNSLNSQPTGNPYLTGGYSTTLSTNKSTFYNTKEVISPTVACVISNKLVANASDFVNTFSVYDLDDQGLKKLSTVSYSDRNKLWLPSDVASRTLAVSQGDHAYLLNNLLNIYRLTLNTKNEPVFTSIYTGWFPATSPTAFNRGVIIGDTLWFLVNNYELWTINPNQITIDFNRPGAVTIVSL